MMYKHWMEELNFRLHDWKWFIKSVIAAEDLRYNPEVFKMRFRTRTQLTNSQHPDYDAGYAI